MIWQIQARCCETKNVLSVEFVLTEHELRPRPVPSDIVEVLDLLVVCPHRLHLVENGSVKSRVHPIERAHEAQEDLSCTGNMYYLLLNHLVFINACIFETLRLEMSKNVERLQNIFLDHPFNEVTTKLYLVTKEKSTFLV